MICCYKLLDWIFLCCRIGGGLEKLVYGGTEWDVYSCVWIENGGFGYYIGVWIW